MKKFVVVLDGQIVHRYESAEQSVFGGPWGQGEQFEIDSSFNLQYVQIVDTEDGIPVFEEVEPANAYKQKRAMEYPSITEYLDGVVKSHSEDIDIAAEGHEQIEKYIADCLAVKAKYPKP